MDYSKEGNYLCLKFHPGSIPTPSLSQPQRLASFHPVPIALKPSLYNLSNSSPLPTSSVRMNQRNLAQYALIVHHRRSTPVRCLVKGNLVVITHWDQLKTIELAWAGRRLRHICRELLHPLHIASPVHQQGADLDISMISRRRTGLDRGPSSKHLDLPAPRWGIGLKVEVACLALRAAVGERKEGAYGVSLIEMAAVDLAVGGVADVVFCAVIVVVMEDDARGLERDETPGVVGWGRGSQCCGCCQEESECLREHF
jgi:hypothetical protein